MTFSQKLRSLSDEELAEWVTIVAECDDCIEDHHGCKPADPENLCERQRSWLHWLQMEVPTGDLYGPPG